PNMHSGPITIPAACSSEMGRSRFFFQAEDGIRDRNVTGVQTCALPISEHGAPLAPSDEWTPVTLQGSYCASDDCVLYVRNRQLRSEERRVGKESRSRGSP